MEKAGKKPNKSKLKLEKIYDIEMFAAEAIQRTLQILPKYSMRLKALDLAGLWLVHQFKWELKQKHGQNLRKKT